MKGKLRFSRNIGDAGGAGGVGFRSLKGPGEPSFQIRTHA